MISVRTGSNLYNAFYDINKNFISNFNTYNKYIEVPENAAYFTSSRATTECEFGFIPLADVEETWKDGVTYTLTPFIENEYVKSASDGSFVSYSGWKRTDYINCVHASKLTVSTACQYGAFYNSHKEVVAELHGKWENNTEFAVPVGACYFVVSNSNDIMDSLVITPSA